MRAATHDALRCSGPRICSMHVCVCIRTWPPAVLPGRHKHILASRGIPGAGPNSNNATWVQATNLRTDNCQDRGAQATPTSGGKLGPPQWNPPICEAGGPIHTYTGTYVCMHACMYAYVDVCMYVCIHIHRYTYGSRYIHLKYNGVVYIYIHPYMQTYM